MATGRSMERLGGFAAICPMRHTEDAPLARQRLKFEVYTTISQCRICGNPELDPILDLGVHALTGMLPANDDVPVTRGDLELVESLGTLGHRSCVLIDRRSDTITSAAVMSSIAGLVGVRPTLELRPFPGGGVR